MESIHSQMWAKPSPGSAKVSMNLKDKKFMFRMQLVISAVLYSTLQTHCFIVFFFLKQWMNQNVATFGLLQLSVTEHFFFYIFS